MSLNITIIRIEYIFKVSGNFFLVLCERSHEGNISEQSNSCVMTKFWILRECGRLSLCIFTGVKGSQPPLFVPGCEWRRQVLANSRTQNSESVGLSHAAWGHCTGNNTFYFLQSSSFVFCFDQEFQMQLAVCRCSLATVSPSTRWPSPLTSWAWSRSEMQYSFGTSWHILRSLQLLSGDANPRRWFKPVIMAPYTALGLTHTLCSGHLPLEEPALQVIEVPQSTFLSCYSSAKKQKEEALIANKLLVLYFSCFLEHRPSHSDQGVILLSNGMPRKLVPVPSSPPPDVHHLDSVDQSG